MQQRLASTFRIADSMEPTEGKPTTRKRRRWLIVAFALVLVSAVSWWYWPRGDARFVGKWAFSVDGGKTTLMEYRLNANGTGSLTDPVNRVFFHWHVDGDALMWGVDSSRWEFLNALAVRALKLTGQTVLTRQHRSRLISVDHDVIQMHQDSANDSQQPPITLTRIPE